MQTTRLYTVLFLSLFVSATASAQVFDPGPSDPTLFTTVLNVPGDELPGNVGGVAGSFTQVNIANDGSTGRGFNANDDSEVNINGGSIADGFRANDGSEINIIDGTVANGFSANEGSQVNISGGTVGNGVQVLGGTLNLSGGSIGEELLTADGGVVNISGGSWAMASLLPTMAP